jgi:hypothetical protein
MQRVQQDIFSAHGLNTLCVKGPSLNRLPSSYSSLLKQLPINHLAQRDCSNNRRRQHTPTEPTAKQHLLHAMQ